MPHRNLSLLALAVAGISPPAALPLATHLAFSIFAVVYFWWAHAFRIKGLNPRVLALLFGVILLALRLGAGSGLTGVPPNFDFNPEQILRLKRSDQVAVRLVFDHEPTAEERYLRLDAHSPPQSSTQAGETGKWAARHLQPLLLEQKIAKIREWYARDFHYSLDSGWTGLDAFLFHEKQGYCLHFTYSTHELLRMSGEKSRMVYGYAGGSWNPVLRTLTYLDSDAHSWLEFWNPKDKTFHRLDPTLWVPGQEPGSDSPFAWRRIQSSLWIFLALVSGLGCMLLLFLQDPRLALHRIVKTRGPISKALVQAALRASNSGSPKLGLLLERLRQEYERNYFARSSGSAVNLKLRFFVLLLRVRIFFSGSRSF